MARVEKPEAAAVADEVAVHRRTEAGLLAHHLPVAHAGRGVAAERAVDAQGGGALIVPAPAEEARGLVGVNPGRADIAQVARKRALQGAARRAAEIGAVAEPQGPQVAITAILLVEARAAVAVDAAVHLVLHQGAQVLVRVGALLAGVAAQPVPAGHRRVLQQAVAALVAHRAVVGMVEHEPLDHVAAELDGLRIRGRDHHAVRGLDHAAHLQALDRPLLELDGAHAAGAHGPQGRMIAEARDHDPQPGRGLDHLGARRDVDRTLVDGQSGHGIIQKSPSFNRFTRTPAPLNPWTL